MRKRILSVLQYLLFLGLGLALIWYSAKDLTPEQMGQLKASFSGARYSYLVPVVIALLASHFSRAMRWRLLMEPMGYHPRRSNTFLAVLLGYFFNLLVPRLGEVMKCTLLARYEHIPADKLIGTILAERAIDLLCLVAVSLLLLLTQYDLLGAPLLDMLRDSGDHKAGMSLWRLAIWLAGFTLLIWGIRTLMRRYARHAIVRRVKAFGRGIVQGLTAVRNLQNRGWFWIHTVFIWAMYLFSIWLGFLAFPPVAHLGWAASLAVLVFGSVGMIVTQGGIGAYQLAVQRTLLLYGVPAVTGLAFGWLIWGAQTAFVIVAGVISLLILPLVNRRKHAS